MLPYLIAGAIGYGIAKLFEDDKAPKYADGGGTLLAPNGQVSNLTPEQYKLVRSKAFKNWFGDWENNPSKASKVIDSNGEPMIVYRGDSSETNIFKGNTFFSSNDYVAGSYSNVDAIPEYNVFLNIRNPLNLLGGNELRRTPNSLRLSGSDPNVVQIFKEAISNLPNDYTIKVGWGDEWGKKTLYDAVINNYEGIEYINYNNQSASWDAIIKYAKLKGFDGVFMYDESIDKIIQGQFSQITFQPEQIKLADGTNTTFDVNNSDIRFNDGGLTNYTEFWNNLVIEDGSKYIGRKFGDVFPFLKGGFSTPFKYKLKVKQYNNYLKRLSEDNYTTKSKKQADLNKIERNKKYIYKVKYLSEFYIDNTGTIIDFKHNNDILFDEGGSVSYYRKYWDNVVIEDGSKYIGRKFGDVFPFLGKQTSPADYRISVKEYNKLLGRLENDNYTTKGMKTADLNRFKKREPIIEKVKYLSRFYLDPSRRIIGFNNSYL